MRLKEKEIKIIKKTALQYFGAKTKVYLFGSRVDENKKGGDIDLYIETGKEKDIIRNKIKMLVELKKQLGDQKIDIVINNFKYTKGIYQIAKTQGVEL